MAKNDIQKLILSEIQELKSEIKEVRQSDIPGIKVKIAVVETNAKAEARQTSKIHSMVWGGITLVVSLTGLAIAYFK